ncbi:MFS family permease [Streptacidiphilus sp. EB129]
MASDTGPRHRVPYRTLLRSGTVLSAAFGCFAAYWLLSASLTWMPDYWHQVVGISPHGTGLITMTAGLTTGAVLLVHGARTSRAASADAPRRRRLPEGAGTGLLVCVAGAGVVGFAVGGPTWLRIALLLGPMALANVILTAAQLACARICPPEQRGVVLGAVACFYALAGALSPLVTGRIVDAAPTVALGYRHAFTVTAVLVLVAGLTAAFFLRPEREACRLAAAAVPVPTPERVPR